MPHPEQEQVKELSAMEMLCESIELSIKVIDSYDVDSNYAKQRKVAYLAVLNTATELLTVEHNREIDIAGKAWDAAIIHDSLPYTAPDKDTYLKSLTQ